MGVCRVTQSATERRWRTQREQQRQRSEKDTMTSKKGSRVGARRGEGGLAEKRADGSAGRRRGAKARCRPKGPWQRGVEARRGDRNRHRTWSSSSLRPRQRAGSSSSLGGKSRCGESEFRWCSIFVGRSENPPPLCPPLSRPLLLPLSPRQREREREERNLYISTHIHEQPAAQRDEQPQEVVLTRLLEESKGILEYSQ